MSGEQTLNEALSDGLCEVEETNEPGVWVGDCPGHNKTEAEGNPEKPVVTGKKTKKKAIIRFVGDRPALETFCETINPSSIFRIRKDCFGVWVENQTALTETVRKLFPKATLEIDESSERDN